MRPDRHLIVNADDFGRTPAITDGVIATHERGIVTSASLMVRWPAAEAAARYARAHSALGVGLHVDVGEWRWQRDAWQRHYEVVDVNSRPALVAEVTAQLDRFRELVGENPTHLDSHHQAHRSEPLRSVLRELADQLRVPLRHETPEVRHHDDFYGRTRTGRALPEAISARRLLEWIGSLGPDLVELRCHPSAWVDDACDYGAMGCLEASTLSDECVRRAIEELRVQLCTFRAASIAPPEGRQALASGDARRAVDIFRGAAADRPDDVWPWLWLARALHAAGDADGALEALLAALAQEPRSLATVEWATALLADDVAGRRDAFGEAVDRARAGGSAAPSPIADAARSLALGDAVGAWSRLRHVPSLASGGDVLARIADALRFDGHLHSSVQVYDRLLETHLESLDVRQARDTVDGELRVLTGASPMPRPRYRSIRPEPPARAARGRAFASRGPERLHASHPCDRASAARGGHRRPRRHRAGVSR